ncbi:unnamed protein product [Staurois parvus]|uniref:Uncharacterized protein n=1 Tax=Staurois parvus TaxID=386267 RepID=A0ABN9FNZ7_9NEOB|nr:unnamed protein product [Staurois parvus]
MTRDCGHSAGDDQRLQTTVQGMTRDCRQCRGCPETADSAGDDQRLQTVQGMTRDCRQQCRG